MNGKINSLFGKFSYWFRVCILKQSGPMTMGASQVCGFAKKWSLSRETPNLQFHVQPISTDILGATKMHDFAWNSLQQ